MFTNSTSTQTPRRQGALEIALHAREMERKCARLNAEDKARFIDQPKKALDPLLTILTSLLAQIH